MGTFAILPPSGIQTLAWNLAAGGRLTATVIAFCLAAQTVAKPPLRCIVPCLAGSVALMRRVMWCSWVDNWFDTAETFQVSWLQTHVADAMAANRPVCNSANTRTAPQPTHACLPVNHSRQDMFSHQGAEYKSRPFWLDRR